SLDLSKLATTLNRLERSIQTGINTSPTREMLIDDINQLQDLLNLLAMHLSNHTTNSTPSTPILPHIITFDQVEHHDKLTSRDKSLDLYAFKLSRLFFSLLSSRSSSCSRSYGAQILSSITKYNTKITIGVLSLSGILMLLALLSWILASLGLDDQQSTFLALGRILHSLQS
ncbi:hypothetical protein Tco_1048838, partial [Tanacetum coccineum]